jgi:hypothetical protein
MNDILLSYTLFLMGLLSPILTKTNQAISLSNGPQFSTILEPSPKSFTLKSHSFHHIYRPDITQRIWFDHLPPTLLSNVIHHSHHSRQASTTVGY